MHGILRRGHRSGPSAGVFQRESTASMNRPPAVKDTRSAASPSFWRRPCANPIAMDRAIPWIWPRTHSERSAPEHSGKIDDCARRSAAPAIEIDSGPSPLAPRARVSSCFIPAAAAFATSCVELREGGVLLLDGDLGERPGGGTLRDALGDGARARRQRRRSAERSPGHAPSERLRATRTERQQRDGDDECGATEHGCHRSIAHATTATTEATPAERYPRRGKNAALPR